jgi:signal transduction histidine kinase
VLVALTGAASAVVAAAVQTTPSAAASLATIGLAWIAYLVVALVVLQAHPGHPVGWLVLVAAAISSVGSGLLEVAYLDLKDQPTSDPAVWAATVGSTGRGLGWLLLVLVLPLVFPDGRRAGPRRLVTLAWRVSLAAVASFSVVSMFSPHQTDLRMDEIDNPIGLPHKFTRAVEALAGLNLVLGAVAIVLAICCLVSRWRQGSELERQQVLWFALAFGAPIIVLLLSFLDNAEPWMFGVSSLPVPVAIGVAVLQKRLYDVQLALNRSLTYGALWLLIACLYAVTVGGVGAMLSTEGAAWLPWVAAGVVAVSFAPLRDALQSGANKLTYGRWSQPREVLADVGKRLSDATDVPGLLGTLATELAAGLGLSTVEITDRTGVVLARHGEGQPTGEKALVAYGEEVGRLRWSGRLLRESDQVLLGDIANQLAAVLHAANLLELVRASQERLVLAREEERKRLRRDLHDGLGSALAGLVLQADTLRNATEPHEDALLSLRDGLAATVLDVRRVVEGLRPPALDQLGLSDALGMLGARVARETGMQVTVEADGLPVLPAAVEVAAFRIAQEALSNAARHAGATRCAVDLSCTGQELLVRICDNGGGGAAPRPGGIGLSSMRERTEEIGGRFTMHPSDGGGTVITAHLPLSGGRT